MESSFHQQFLREELARRCQANPHYSLRSFARALDLDAGTLSRVMAQKRPISIKHARRVMDSLALTGSVRSQFLESVSQEHLRQQLPLEAGRSLSEEPTELDTDLFRVLGEWYHFAILELTYLPEFEGSPGWIAKQLGIRPAEALLALGRLQRVGLLEKKRGRLRKTNRILSTKDKHRTTPFLKQHQKQMLERAIRSIEVDDISVRQMNGLTMAIDPRKLPLAKKLVENFMVSVCKVLESGTPKQVYQMQVALFPLQGKP